jgi:hypothetical protein
MIRNSFTAAFVPIITIIIEMICRWQQLVFTKVAGIQSGDY